MQDKTDTLRRQYFGHLWTNALTNFMDSSIVTQLVKDDRVQYFEVVNGLLYVV